MHNLCVVYENKLDQITTTTKKEKKLESVVIYIVTKDYWHITNKQTNLSNFSAQQLEKSHTSLLAKTEM